jgi:two-component system sensor histidine kinase RegB
MLLLLAMAFKRQSRLNPWLMLVILTLEIVSINVVIAINGAASNPFNAVLLVPLILAFMLLPLRHSAGLLLLSIMSQIVQILLLPEHDHHHGMMQEHSYAMVGSFILTSMLIAVVVCYFHYQLANQESALQKLRERQLRDEQLLAIGTAAAQLTHDVATPAQSIRLLLEEGQEQQHSKEWLESLDSQFQNIEQQLRTWREVADDVREHRLHSYNINKLTESLRQLIQIARPEAQIQWQFQHENEQQYVLADRTLLPALTSVIINACEAAVKSTNKRITITAKINKSDWFLQIDNQCKNMPNGVLTSLGSQLLPSRHGHGLGAVLTNATIEKFSGEVNWQFIDDMITTTINLPLDT